MSDAASRPKSGRSDEQTVLPQTLAAMVGRNSTGRLRAAPEDGAPLDVWFRNGRVVNASWGPLRALSALEMAAIFLPPAHFDFTAEDEIPEGAFDLSLMDVSWRLAEVARAGAELRPPVPGPEAVPAMLDANRARTSDAEATRLLDRIDGQRSVAELVEGRQPLVVLRGLASLAEAGAITFDGGMPEASVETPPDTAQDGSRQRRWPLLIALVVLVLAVVGVVRAFPGEEPAARVGAIQSQAEAPLPTGVPTAVPSPTSVPTPVPSRTSVPVAVPSPTTVPVPSPTSLPTAVPSPTTMPTPVPSPTSAPTAAPSPTSAPTAVPTIAPRAVLDESFTTGAPGWPNAADSSAFVDADGYHLVPRVAGQHVAITAPGGTPPGDVVVTALFRKLGGPAGGGSGVIVRAQGTLNGTSQGGRYYVFEVGDRGEVGAWRRDDDHWVDLQSWTPSSAVQAGTAENRIEVEARGTQFTFKVNDTVVAQVSDTALNAGAVGVFVGGDGNQILLERFSVAAL